MRAISVWQAVIRLLLVAAFVPVIVWVAVAAFAPPPVIAQPVSQSQSSAGATGSPAPSPTPRPSATPLPTATPKPTASPAASTIGTLPIVIIADPKGTAFKKPGPYELLRQQLNSYNGTFTAWIADNPPSDCKVCKLANARIIIRGTETESNLAFQAIAVPGYKITGSLKVDISKAKDSPVSLSDENIAALVGPLTVDASYRIVAKAAGYLPILQLVPNPVQNADPDYEPVLEHLLGENGIAAQRSSYTTSGIGAPDDGTTCTDGERYLVYRLRFEQRPHKLAGTTSVTAYSEGYVLDCTRLGYAPSATGAARSKVATSNTLLNNVSGLLVALAVAPKASWRGVTGSISAFSTLVDEDPTSSTVRDNVAARSLRGLVGNLCVQLSATATPTPTPTPTSTPEPTTTPVRSGWDQIASLPTGGGTAPAASAQTVLPSQAFAGSSPIPLACGKPLPDTSLNSTSSGVNSASYDGLRLRWVHYPTPPPTPTQ